MLLTMTQVLQGFNCTIFAYGQTGTGKTYTMSGDITEQSPLPENAGIIPRVLESLFSKLDALPDSPSSGAAPETSVKISFIELYNEELRDLLSVDETAKLKIVDGDGKRSASTLVHGMEETYITNARKGVQLLRSGSHKRQVAATKCNDLSSRSHTVFTVNVCTKRTSESGEEQLSIGKLNLVDLAGSENIQRSGAENKRATEAGLINKSLLTLGRVINSLVDRASHIPYRESKLTRLLQDSLGGRTKTCIIATVSPARSNLEETISTLDYAFRAKNIKNKPQVNQLLSKKTLLKEFTIEIEKLKTELMATRRKNGVYLTQESYEELSNESESRRIQIKEQKERIETIECNLNRKIQDLFALTSSLTSLKKDHETTKTMLESTKGILEKTEAVLEYTRNALEEEMFIRAQHEKTEERLAASNKNLISTLGQTTDDIGGLHAKLRRRSDVHSMHRQHFSDTQKDVSDVTTMVEDRVQEFQEEQQALMERLSSRMQKFVQDELEKLDSARQDLKQKSTSFNLSHKQVEEQTAQSKKNLDTVLGEVKHLREDVKDKVGAGLSDLGIATQRISAGILSEIETFHSQLHTSYSAMGRDFKSTFDDLTKEIAEQREELDALRTQMCNANQRLDQEQKQTTDRFAELVEKEKELREQENRDLMQRIQLLVENTAKQQGLRMQEVGSLPAQYRNIGDIHSKANETFSQTSKVLVDRSKEFGARVAKSRDSMKIKLQGDFAVSLHDLEHKKLANSLRLRTSTLTFYETLLPLSMLRLLVS
jgi:kinesin family protein 11